MSWQAGALLAAVMVLQTLPGIDVLINNVGGYWNNRHITADGLERTFALNHLAPFLLTNFGAEEPNSTQRLLSPFLWPFMKTPARGATTSIRLASDTGLQQVTRHGFSG
jgi:NAD(P)-dependent dehydrogenase (short-subunit alcohol dehydrogenase family)